MFKCAIITPGFLPVPAIKGGAVESLVTTLIDLNEKEKEFYFDVFTIGTKEGNIQQKYDYTNINDIQISVIDKLIERILNKIFSVLHIKQYISKYDNLVGKKLRKSNKKYDYILIENNMYLYNKVIKNYRYKTKYIYHLHNDIGGRDKPIKLCKVIANSAHCVLTVSEFLKKKFIKVTGFEKVKTYYNCINTNNFDNKNFLHQRKELGLQENDIVFMYVGRFEKEKGLLELITSFKEVNRKYSNTKLLIIGDNTKRNKYTKRIIKYSIEMKDKIKFVGYVENGNLKTYYDISDVIVIPSICDEAFGMVAIESMSLRKPLIVANRGGIPEVVNDKCAILIDKNNFIQKLAKAMEKMVEEPQNIKNMGNAGYNRFISIKEFNSNYYLKTFNNLIK